jgi:hypothetical protein
MLERIGREFPDWHVYFGVGHVWYARRQPPTPVALVRAESLDELRMLLIEYSRSP